MMKRILDIIRRELHIWKIRPVYWLAPLAALTFCSVFFLTFFGKGTPENLPVAVVDLDNSSLTRNFIRQLDATELASVERYPTWESAREALQKGEVTAVCVLPARMYADVLSQRQPTFTFYVNTMYFIGGAMSYKNILTMINLTIGAVQRETMRAMGIPEDAAMAMIQPLQIDIHQIGNPTADYSVYLSNILLPGLIELLVIIMAAYSLGTELKYGTSRELLRLSGGSMTGTLVGKLALYAVYFTLLGWILDIVLYGLMDFPLEGSIWAMMLNMLLLVLASEAFAVCIVGLFPVCRVAICISAFLGILAFSLSGFTVPLEQMPPYVRSLAVIFPLRPYYRFYVQETIFGSGFAGWWKDVIHYLLFLLAPLPLLGRLKGAYVYQNYQRN